MRLYALCDQDMLHALQVSLEEFMLIAKKNDAKLLQYRSKNASIEQIKEKLILIKQNYDGTLIVNDAYELIDYCDGVHMGQEDLIKVHKNKTKAVEILRQKYVKKKILGISTHNKEEILQANIMDVDYIGLGAYRQSNTKSNLAYFLGDDLDKLAALSLHKVAAIGGVKHEDHFENVSYKVMGSGLL